MTGGSEGPPDGQEFAWRVHDALDSWTAKVDVKASIAVAIESAAFGFVVTQSGSGERFASLSGSRLDWYRAGIALLLWSVLTSLAVVMPQLRRLRSRREWRQNTIYFGHLRHWEAESLAEALRQNQRSELQLANPLITMSRIAWRKHAWLQWSLVGLTAGVACLVGVAITV
jgi:Family of unknown function (DUF5706)